MEEFKETFRKLVTVRKVKEIKRIDGADLIEVAVVDGWQCVVKRDEFKVGDLAAYFEIDSFLPLEPEFLFLEKSSKRRMGEFEGLRLKTIKLRGVLSQGLLLPYAVIERFVTKDDFVLGADITDALGVKKYEQPIPAELVGQVRGSFPSFIQKTDQERVQNIYDNYSCEFVKNDNEQIIAELESFGDKYIDRINELKNESATINIIKDLSFEETLKLDGTSCTFYVIDVTKIETKVTDDMDIQDNVYFGHCSRNLDTKDKDTTPWQIARSLKIKDNLIAFQKRTGRNIALQGELMGPGIQGNREKLSKCEFYLFDVWDIDEQRYFTRAEREELLIEIPNVNHAPVLNKEIKVFQQFKNIDDLLEYSNGKSINHDIREGIVFKSTELVNGRTVSFKVISNQFLLKEK